MPEPESDSQVRSKVGEGVSAAVLGVAWIGAACAVIVSAGWFLLLTLCGRGLGGPPDLDAQVLFEALAPLGLTLLAIVVLWVITRRSRERRERRVWDGRPPSER